MRKTRLLAASTTLLILLLLQWQLAANPAAQRASIRQEMTTTEMFASGIGKLTPAEIANLEEWFHRRYTTPNWEQARSRQLADWQTQREAVRLHQTDPPAAQEEEANVIFNSRSGVIHRHNCRYISRCTNCSPATLSYATGSGASLLVGPRI